MEVVGTAMVREEEGGRNRDGERKCREKRRNVELMELHGVVRSGSCNGHRAWKCSGGARKEIQRWLGSTAADKKGMQSNTITGVFNLPPSSFSC